MYSLISKANSIYGKYFLLSIDFAFILASLLRHRLRFYFDESLLSVSTDGGYGEIFQYIKLALIVALLCISAVSERSIAIGGWAVLFALLLADDMLSLHEQWGSQLAEAFSFQSVFHLRPIDYGEMIVFAAWGILAALILAFTYRTARSPITKQIAKGMLLSLSGLAVFGGFFDMLHIAALDLGRLSPRGESLLNAIEDGGEMVVVSLTLYFVYQMALKAIVRRADKSIHPCEQDKPQI